jgi:hypothetical protein
MSSELNFFRDSDGERLAELLELVNCCGNRGFRTEEVLLFFVDRLALSDGLFHLEDSVVFLLESAKAFGD